MLAKLVVRYLVPASIAVLCVGCGSSGVVRLFHSGSVMDYKVKNARVVRGTLRYEFQGVKHSTNMEYIFRED